MLLWLVLFCCLWIVFQPLYGRKSFETQLDCIKQEISNDNWEKAKEYTDQFKKNFHNKSCYIQINNATEAYTTFVHAIGQLDFAVNSNQKSALEYVGQLKAMLNFVIDPFAGP